MTREEIEQQAKSYTLAVFDKLDDLSDITDAYIDGAEWMQEITIKKVEQWLTNSGRGQMIGSLHRFLEEQL